MYHCLGLAHSHFDASLGVRTGAWHLLNVPILPISHYTTTIYLSNCQSKPIATHISFLVATHTLDCQIHLLKVLTPSRVVSEKCLVCSHRSFLNLSIYCFYSTILFVSRLRKTIQRWHGLESHEGTIDESKHTFLLG